MYACGTAGPASSAPASCSTFILIVSVFRQALGPWFSPGRPTIMGLVVHHLHVAQSERVVWLCEELGLDYELRTYTRAASMMAPAEYKALHRAGTAPVVQDGDLTLAESGACIEYISHRHGGGWLFLPPAHPAYADFLYWWHWNQRHLPAGPRPRFDGPRPRRPRGRPHRPRARRPR